MRCKDFLIISTGMKSIPYHCHNLLWGGKWVERIVRQNTPPSRHSCWISFIRNYTVIYSKINTYERATPASTLRRKKILLFSAGESVVHGEVETV
jgi:hypothetical protein